MARQDGETRSLLEKCLRAANPPATQVTEAERHIYCSVRDSLREELALLLQEAEEMRWPFVPEKWQYKQTISSDDKSNLSELVGQHLPQLLNILEAAIVAQEAHAALAVIFLVDRFLYWIDESGQLLKISKLLHKRYPDVPVAPQLVIRQARVYLNSGKLQKAEYILSHLIIDSGATGCWLYRSESDRALVQSVSLQVRGMVLQKLGLWLEAAQLIWASLLGFYTLPQPDKKGIGTSLGILANILLSMNDEDFHAFKTTPDIDLSFLGDASHRLLSAAKAAKRAVAYSRYTSLYVLTNATAQGTCLLSYSFSLACLPAKRTLFLLEAKEAFEVGLLSKAEGEVVTSKQELHTFIKAAYSLLVTHKWLYGASEAVTRSTKVCQEALARFYHYSHPDAVDRDGFCAEIMRHISRVKLELRVEPFVNSDSRSFIPDTFRNVNDVLVGFTSDDFSSVLQRFHKYHSALCTTADFKSNGQRVDVDGAGICITAFGTTVDVLDPESVGEAGKPSSECASDVSELPDRSSSVTNAKSLSSSWKRLSLTSSGSGRSAVGHFSSSVSSHGSDKFEIIQADIPTADSEDDDPDGLSLSQLILSSSLSNSFGSKSSWEHISASLGSSRSAGIHERAKSFESSGSVFLKTPQDCEDNDTTGWEVLGLPKALENFKGDAGNCSSTETSTDDCHGTAEESIVGPQTWNLGCNSCLKIHSLSHVAPARQYYLSQEDYRSLLAGVCHQCLLKRLRSEKVKFKLERYGTTHNALHLKFSKASGLWTARETCVHIGESMGLQGTHRTAFWVQFLHQEERLSSYVGKDYRKPTQIQFHLRDVERQMTAQYYVTEFNKSLYDKEVMAQMFFLPSEALLILDGDVIAGCITVEPFMLGQFVKLTNNVKKKNDKLPATEYGLAFGHFTYLHSECQDVVVDLQGAAYKTRNGCRYKMTNTFAVFTGWVTANGKGLTYLTDPQIHSTRTPRGPSNLASSGIATFLREQHGPECNSVCRRLNLPPVPQQSS
ncbi:alpha-protein kinase 1 isoform X1 [Syngnathus typhle]|uniref:alpha-protein kinase 1 isoform X1 n=1 Tax=Syngnathus typhle TaxID=161592 RepID=UPI002A6A3F88|nr:alpha-protein kinase 1 isoform X1 [Syngnathus typhle]XP_061132847.1 alpha-protein kinase 1 isoform X1 [Syngnathus typhle]XP_061132855.1 alpha-protein kinase 1 isoform X1 [Syngnathus typhle]XP_061132863.1 alpha-protein kinase 1 isoform X1 [Syngnathus typhle]XP_061132870.1 alpha-protein kinase 1 isoform X1 [Syngnathus typhle]